MIMELNVLHLPWFPTIGEINARIYLYRLDNIRMESSQADELGKNVTGNQFFTNKP